MISAQLEVDAAPVALQALALVAGLDVAEAREDVDADGHLHLLGRGPEALVVVRSEGQLLRRHLPDQRSPQPRLLAAFQLRHRVVHVVGGDHRHPHQPVQVHLAVFDEPVVVGPAGRLMKRGVLIREQAQRVGGIQHLGADPVRRHLLEPGVGIGPSGMGLESLSNLQLGKARGAVPHGLRHAAHDGVRGLHHVGIRGEQHFVPEDSARRLPEGAAIKARIDAHGLTPFCQYVVFVASVVPLYVAGAGGFETRPYISLPRALRCRQGALIRCRGGFQTRPRPDNKKPLRFV